MAETKKTTKNQDGENKEEQTKQKQAAQEAEKQDLANASDDYDLAELEDFNLDELTGIDSINSADIRVPYGKLYSKAQDGHEIGDIVLPDGTTYKGKDGEVLPELSILKIQPVRVYFPSPFKKGNTFICRSLDGKVGASDGKYAGRDCSTCEFAQFPKEGGSSPCREQRLLLCTVPDGTMFYLLITGIGVSDFKKTFMSVEMMNGLRIVNRKLKKNVLAALRLNVHVEMEETDYGPFPKMMFKVDREHPLVTPDRLKGNLEAYKSYKEFEDEAIRTAATFSQSESEYGEETEAEPSGENSEMF